MVYVIFPQAGPKSGLNLTSSVISLTREAVFYNIDAGKTIVEKVILKPYPSMKKNIFSSLSGGQRQDFFVDQIFLKGSRGQRDNEIFSLRVDPIPEGVKGLMRKYFYLQPTK